MVKRNTKNYVNGTLALEIPRWVEASDDAKIIAFPGAHQGLCDHVAIAQPKKQHEDSRLGQTLSKVFASSEMYCSLRLESMNGCPYEVFTKAGVAALSTGAGVIAVISLALGA